MATIAQVSVEEYLKTIYEPDRDLVNGVTEERSLGEYEHGVIQITLAGIFLRHAKEWNVRPVTECRTQVSAQNFRVPDLIVLHRYQKVHRIVTEPPLICIEILSPEDTLTRMRLKLDDYLNFGVPHVWAFESESPVAYRYTRDGFQIVHDAELTIPGTPIRISLAEVFSALDQ